MSTLIIRSAVCLLLAAAGIAQSPVLSTFNPRGAQRGTEVELSISGSRLEGLQDLFFFRDGIEVLEIVRKARSSAVVRLRVSPLCPLGTHPFRLRTDRGITNLKTFHVGPLPEIAERAPNDSPEQAHEIPLGVTVNGTLGREDIDWFAVKVPAGATAVLEVQGNRLGIDFDPRVTIYDAEHRQVQRADDSAFGRMDPICQLDNSAGADPATYFVELDDAALERTGSYRLHAGMFPRPVGAIPCGGRPGETIEVTYLGESTTWTERVQLPERTPSFYEHSPVDDRGTAPTPIRFAVRDIPNVVEPQDDAARKPLEFASPAAINGVLTREGEVDRYYFQAAKGQRLTLKAVARRLRSAVDPVISVRQRKGNYRVANDDSGGHPDSVVSFRAPADGIYDVFVYDRLRRGGPAHFYRVEVARPDTRQTTRVLFNGRRDAEAVSVPAGARMMTVISARNAPSGTELALMNLPPGVSAWAGSFGRGASQVPLVLEAAADAPLAGSLASVGLRLPGRSDVGVNTFEHVVPLVTVRNNNTYSREIAYSLPVAVTAKPQFKVDIKAPAVPIIKGSGLRLTAVVTREEGFKEAVRVRLPWTPPGITAGEVTVPAGKTEAQLSLSARTSARAGEWKIAGYGYATIGGGILRISSALTPLTVAEPWMTATIGKARTEQGSPTELVVKLKPATAFDGEAEITLSNLPRGVTAPKLKIVADAKEVTFPLTVAANAAAGRHRSMALRMQIPSPEGLLAHDFRGGELRIDKPLASPANPVK